MRLLNSTAIATLLLATSVQAGPKVLPRNNADGYLVDAAHILSSVDDSQLNLKLLAYRERTGNQFAVVIVPDLGDSTIQEYANTLFHEWGIGVKGQDNGVLLLWTIKERKVRLEVGRGLEESLPDGRAGIIIRDNILPNFKAQRWRSGVEQGVDAVIAQLDIKPVVPAAPPPKVATSSTPDVYFVMGFLVLGIAVAAFFVWYSKEEDPIAPVTPDYKKPLLGQHSTYSDFSPRPPSSLPRNTAPRVLPAAVAPIRRRTEPAPRKREDAPSTYIPIPIPIPYDSGSSSWSSSDSGGGTSDSGGGFGGGDSGGGGADGGY